MRVVFCPYMYGLKLHIPFFGCCFKMCIRDSADIIAPRSFELHLLSLQLETREFLEAKLKDHATPGGMTEEAVSGFRQLWTGKDWMEGDVSMAYDISYRLAERVYKKGKALEKRR